MIPSPLSPNAIKFADFIRGIFKPPDGDDLLPSLELPTVSEILEALLEEAKKLYGVNWLDDIYGSLNKESNIEGASDFVRKVVSGIFNQPLAEETAEVMGSVVMGPFISLMERYASDPELDPEDFAAAFHGLNIMLTLPEMIAHAFRGHAVGTFIGPFAEGFKSIYWNLGLGFLGWQTLAPFLSAGLQPRLERHYNAKFMPKRFDLSTQTYLYNIGKIGPGDLLRAGKELGWRPVDTQLVIDMSYRSLSDTDLTDLYTAGVLNVDGIKQELLKRGENPRYIPTYIKRITLQETDKDKSPSITQIRDAYKLGLMSELEFRRLMKLLGYGDSAINLELQLIRAKLKNDAQQLSQNQIKDAFVKDIISSAEVVHYLNEQGLTPQDTETLMMTWRALKRPKLLKVNQSTIKDALRLGVLNSSQALAKLLDIGYEPSAAQLIIDTALAAMRIARATISVDRLIAALAVNIITETEFKTQLKARQYDDFSINVLARLAKSQKAGGLTVEDIHQAYIYGAIDESQAVDYQVEIAEQRDNAQLRLETWRKQKQTFRQTPTIGALILWYQQNLISSTQLQTRLTQAGFTNEEAQLTVKSADGAIPRDATSSEIKEMYSNAVISKDKAINLLRAGGLTQQSAADLITAWDRLLMSKIPSASVNHLLAAYADEIITEDELAQKLKEKGYKADTIDFYINLANGQTFEVTKELTKADVIGLFKDGMITYENALERLIKQGYSADDSELLLARGKPGIEDSQAHTLFTAGYIDPDSYAEILLGLNYSMDEINAYLTKLGF